MSSRTKYHITHKDGDWNVKREGADRPAKTFANKSDATDYGRDIVKKQELGQLIIYNKDETIQTEYTYGKDSYPPKG